MKIRKAQEKDIDRILDLLIQVNNVHHTLRPDLFIKDKTKYTREELRTVIADDQTPVFVAVDEEDMVLGYAFGMFEDHTHYSNYQDVVTFYIDDICVDAAARRRHVGESLFLYVKEFARKSGCHNITLNVWGNNDAADRFYESCGFHVQKKGMEMIID